MRLKLLISAIAVMSLMFQPAALASSINIDAQFNPQKNISIIAVENINTEEGFDFSKWKEKLQTTTAQLWEQVPSDYIGDITSDFQSKLSNIEKIPEEFTKVGSWYQDLIGNINNSIENIQVWRSDLVNNTKEQIAYIQTLSNSLVGDTQEQLEYIQKLTVDLATDTQSKIDGFQQWTSGLASNAKFDLSILTDKLAEIQHFAEAEANVEEVDEIQQIEEMAVALSEQLTKIQQEIETEANPEEIAEIEKAQAIATNLSQQLTKIQQEIETEANPEEMAEIEQAESITDTLATELNKMEQVAESTAILSEELAEISELQENVAETEESIESVVEPELADLETSEEEIDRSLMVTSTAEEMENFEDSDIEISVTEPTKEPESLSSVIQESDRPQENIAEIEVIDSSETAEDIEPEIALEIDEPDTDVTDEDSEKSEGKEEIALEIE
ncbi:MAG: hypothetical protein AB4368_33720 [Xenococcaceae cyanobacterium]